MAMQKVLQYKIDQNSWRLLEKAVLIEKAETKHTYEDPGIEAKLVTRGARRTVSLARTGCPRRVLPRLQRQCRSRPG